MARSDWILPRADATCGKVFHRDRQTAEGYRIALEFWNQATGRTREDQRLVSYRCKRCGGFHVARKRTPAVPNGVGTHGASECSAPDLGRTELHLEIHDQELETQLMAAHWYVPEN